MKRRDLLGLAGGAIVGAAVRLPFGDLLAAIQTPSTAARSTFLPDVELALRAAPGEAQILPGAATRVWRFTGSVLKGPPECLQVVPDSYLGPILRFRKGQKVRIRFSNALPEPTIVHWHGLDLPAAMDGHPRSAIGSGRDFVYEFEVINRAGTYWYHPHHHDRTGPQVLNGLAGLLIVADEIEGALGLPSGGDEILCVLQDRTFDADNQFVYLSGMPMDQMAGFLGERVIISGRVPSPLTLGTRAYRVRLLNGSNSRVYKLAWNDGTPMSVIGSDGGLLETPLRRPYLTLAPGQRADVILDLTRRPVGTSLQLQSLAFPSAPFEMMMGMGMGMARGRGMGMGRGRQGVPANGAPLPILSIRVGRRESAGFRLPETLSTFDAAWRPAKPGSAPTRVVKVDFRQMQWLLNGRSFEMESVAPGETVKAGSQEVWEFDNSGAAMMGMRLAHPLHLHGRQFRVLSRRIDPAFRNDWQSLREGFIDEGWVDTVLVMPGERVQVLVRFTQYPGLYLYHCHNLEHEDMGMMRNYRVVT
jgi:FtsP/CotA-like multicopper oxidase with cupredoxin domain